MKTGKLLIWLFTFVFMCPLHIDAKKVKYSSHMYYEGDVSGGKPNGEGILYCTLNKVENFGSGLVRFMTDKNYDPLTAQKAKDGVCDMIKGTFSDTRVSNAKVLFNSGWMYYGDLLFDPSEKDYVSIAFAEGGIIVAPSDYSDRYFNNKVQITESFVIKRKLDTFGFGCSEISINAKTGLKPQMIISEGLPSTFLIENNYSVALKIKQVVRNKTEEWQWELVPNALYKNKKGYTVKTNSSSGKNSFVYSAPNGDFYNSGTGRYRLTLSEGIVGYVKESNDNIILYNNGDKFVGTIRFVDRKKNQYITKPSFDPNSSCYIGNITISNIKAYTGQFTSATGESYRLIDGLTEEEYMAKVEAQQEEQRLRQQKAKAEAAAAQAKADAAKKASAAKINEAKKQLASVQHGKTYYFNCYYTPYSGNWEVTHGNASIRFYANGQDILLRVGGSLTYLHFSEITKDGDLSCYETNNPFYGTWYITILTVNGKKAFKLRRPVMGIQYLLKNPSKVGY